MQTKFEYSTKLIQTLEALLVLLGRVYLTSVDLGLECLLFVSLLVELHLGIMQTSFFFYDHLHFSLSGRNKPRGSTSVHV